MYQERFVGGAILCTVVVGCQGEYVEGGGIRETENIYYVKGEEGEEDRATAWGQVSIEAKNLYECLGVQQVLPLQTFPQVHVV